MGKGSKKILKSSHDFFLLILDIEIFSCIGGTPHGSLQAHLAPYTHTKQTKPCRGQHTDVIAHVVPKSGI